MHLADSPDTDPVFHAYLSALAESFHDEPWEAIEQYAQRIWSECRMDGDADWHTIRERARDAWPYEASRARPGRPRDAGDPA